MKGKIQNVQRCKAVEILRPKILEVAFNTPLCVHVNKYHYVYMYVTAWLLPGILLGPWSPSFGNVIFVPALHPCLTLMVKILSRMFDVCPSSFITC